MAMILKYNLLNQCYNNIIKLIIDLILAKPNMQKDLYQSKKIVSGLKMNYDKIDACEKKYWGQSHYLNVWQPAHQGDADVAEKTVSNNFKCYT
jgi:hypothetical protein